MKQIFIFLGIIITLFIVGTTLSNIFMTSPGS